MAGVTAILPLTDASFLTGSYDCSIRLMDYRNIKSPVCKIDLDGGVWRILPRPQHNATSFLICCMQAGARTASLIDSGSTYTSLEKQAIFEPPEERRLIYGASWYSESEAAVSSFYEKKVYFCRIP